MNENTPIPPAAEKSSSLNLIVCAICSEPVELAGTVWHHAHSNEAYCYTGDGSVAWPRLVVRS